MFPGPLCDNGPHTRGIRPLHATGNLGISFELGRLVLCSPSL
jgi:hypothetical protein